jgi:hypothetical protein
MDGVSHKADQHLEADFDDSDSEYEEAKESRSGSAARLLFPDKKTTLDPPIRGLRCGLALLKPVLRCQYQSQGTIFSSQIQALPMKAAYNRTTAVLLLTHIGEITCA